MQLKPTALPDVWILESPVYRDARGSFVEVFHELKFVSLGIPSVFAQDNHSYSVQHTLRGLHLQLHEPQGKLVRAVTGHIFDVAVDVRVNSATFGQWAGVDLVAGNGQQLWIPPGFAHGFLVVSESADVSYKCTTLYDASSERTIAWNDPTIKIAWPLTPAFPPLLSKKDSEAPTLAQLKGQL